MESLKVMIHGKNKIELFKITSDHYEAYLNGKAIASFGGQGTMALLNEAGALCGMDTLYKLYLTDMEPTDSKLVKEFRGEYSLT